MNTAPPMAPATIQKARRPKAERQRSEMTPTTGWAKRVKKEPIDIMREIDLARAASYWASRSSRCCCSAVAVPVPASTACLRSVSAWTALTSWTLVLAK